MTITCHSLLRLLFAVSIVLAMLFMGLPIPQIATVATSSTRATSNISVGTAELASPGPGEISQTDTGGNFTEAELGIPNSKLVSQLEQLYKQKQALTPAQKKIDSDVLQVVQQAQAKALALSQGEKLEFQGLSNDMLRVNDAGDVEIKLSVTSLTAQQIEELKALGMQLTTTLPEYGLVEGGLPFDHIEAVAALDFVARVSAPGYPLPNTGAVDSAGDTVLQASAARSAFGVDGSGIKVGVISGDVAYLSASVATGDLPSSPAVQVLQAGSSNEGEGTEMLEIVHDLAPGAQLAFYGSTSSSDMVNGIRALEAAGCKVVVDDFTYADQPKFEDGPIAIEARQFCTDGGVYVTSAGNFADGHYESTYNRSSFGYSVGQLSWPYAHNYASGSTVNQGNGFLIPNGKSVSVFLEWNNRWGQSADDFDLFLVDSNGNLLSWSIGSQNGSGYPWEGLTYPNNTGSTVAAYVVIAEYNLVSPPSSLVLDCYVHQDNFYSSLQYATAEDSVWGQAAVSQVLSVAAADAATPGAIEPYSSCGKATIYFPTYEERQVPNITGVDDVQTEVGQLVYSGNPFYGTSAAAPHVAAIAALVWSANPGLTSTQVFNAITSSAVDLLSPGWDISSGFGRANAYAAVQSVQTAPSVAFSSATYSVAENAGPATITVNLSGASAQTVTVNYATSDGNATAGSDYTAASGTLTFNPGDTSKTFNITILDDPIFEGNVTVNLDLSSPGNATLGSPNIAVLTIIDIRHQDIPLNQGWNLISLPLIPDNTSIEVVLAGIENNTLSVFSYDANSTANPWSSWIPRSGIPASLTEMTDCKGYWINMSVPDTLTVSGTPSI